MHFHPHNARHRVQAFAGDSHDRGGRRFAEAVLMARKGRYAEASLLLLQAREAGECSETEALDLQARIYAQQGLYLYAESCWRKAQSLDGTNAAYADALDRLRQAGNPTAHLHRPLAMLGGLVILFLLVWQTGVVNPGIRARQDAAEQSLAAIQGRLGTLDDDSKARDRGHAAALAGVGRNLQDFDRRLSERLGTLSTASSLTESRNVIVGHVDAKIAAFECSMTERLDKADEREATAEAAREKRLGLIEAGLARLQETASGVEARAVARDREIQSALATRVGAAESGLRQDLKPLATSAEAAALRQSLANLERQTGLLTAAVQELKQAASRSESRDEPAKPVPVTQPAPPRAIRNAQTQPTGTGSTPAD